MKEHAARCCSMRCQILELAAGPYVVNLSSNPGGYQHSVGIWDGKRSAFNCIWFTLLALMAAFYSAVPKTIPRMGTRQTTACQLGILLPIGERSPRRFEWFGVCSAIPEAGSTPSCTEEMVRQIKDRVLEGERGLLAVDNCSRARSCKDLAFQLLSTKRLVSSLKC